MLSDDFLGEMRVLPGSSLDEVLHVLRRTASAQQSAETSDVADITFRVRGFDNPDDVENIEDVEEVDEE
jgi:hypothetical protein